MKTLAKYLGLTFGITWVCWWGDAILVAVLPLVESDPLPMILFTIGGLGPAIAACACLDGGFSWRGLGRFLAGHEKGGAFFFVTMILLEIVVFVLTSGGLAEPITNASIPSGVIVATVFLQAAVLFGGSEELGWRGMMQPVLQEKFSHWQAILIVGLVWVCWHIPLWFIEGNSHQGMPFIFFAALGLILSYWLGATYNITKSVICCMALHGLTNTLMGVLVLNVDVAFVLGLVALTVLAIVADVLNEKRRTSREGNAEKKKG